MSSDFEGYEQDFAVLTAEITNKIARVPRLPPGESGGREGVPGALAGLGGAWRLCGWPWQPPPAPTQGWGLAGLWGEQRNPVFPVATLWIRILTAPPLELVVGAFLLRRCIPEMQVST